MCCFTIKNILLTIFIIFFVYKTGLSQNNRGKIKPAFNINVSEKIKLVPFDLKDVTEDFKQKMVKGIELTYQNSPDLKEPFEIFDQLIIERPDRPEGYFLKASLYFSLYMVESKQSIFDSLKTYSDKAIEISEKLLKADPDDKYYNFYLGAAYGNMGLFYLKTKSYWSAYRKGKKGIKYLDKALKIDPDFGDAQLGKGIFLYYASVLSAYIKPLLFIVGMSGDKEKGLKNLLESVENSQLSRIEARDFLSKIYGEYEGKKNETMKMLKQLNENFPTNPYYLLNYAVYTYETGDYLKAKKLFEEFNTLPLLRFNYYKRNGAYYLGTIEYLLGNYKRSTELLTSSLKFPVISKSSNNFKRSVLYRIGLNYEYDGGREKALHYYNESGSIKAKNIKEKLIKILKNPLDDFDKRKKRNKKHN